MNEAWERSLRFHYKHLYYGESHIDIEYIQPSFRELHRALSLLPECQKNRFPLHAIRNKLEDNDKSEEDFAPFEDFSSRIQRTLKDPKDSMFMEAYFDLADEDGDGFINYDELTRVATELSRDCMNDKAFLALTEKLSEEGTKLNKSECIEILKRYL